MTVIKFRVRRSAWRGIPQAQVQLYAGNVFTLTDGKVSYVPIQPAVTSLGAANTILFDLLKAAKNGNHSVIEEKDIALQVVLDRLGAVADGLEYNAGDDPLYITKAGMQLRKARVQHTGDLLPVENLVAVSNGLEGQAHLTFKCPIDQRSQIETFAVEWSEDDQVTWSNGTYKNSERITVKDLPERKDIWFRVRCLGTRSRQSPWSAADSTFVV